MRQSPASIRSFALAFAAMVWTLAPLGTALHAAEHPHRYCSEHRAFEEGTGVAGVSSPPSAAQPGWASAAATEDAGRHVLCPITPPSSRDGATVSSTHAVPAHAPSKATLAPVWRTHHLAIHHLALAPKSSPPASFDVVEA